MRGRALGWGRRAQTRGMRRERTRVRATWFAAATLLSLAWWSLGAASGQPAPKEDVVYGYIDDHGRMVHAQSLEDIPPRLRPYARRVDLPSEDSSLAALLATKVGSGARPVIYRYVTPQGRTRYTNLLASVPVPQRSAAEVDLSRVSVNSEVGKDLDRAMAQEHERLAQGPVCQQLRAAAAQSLWRTIWDDHAPLVVIGAVFVVLLLITPAMLERVGANWAKAFSMSVSVLAALGLFSYATLRGTDALSQLKAKAAPCAPGGWGELAKNDTSVLGRLQLLKGMEAEQQRALEQIAAEGR
jgi:hypothetical protein